MTYWRQQKQSAKKDLVGSWSTETMKVFCIHLVQFLHLSIAKVIFPRDWNSIRSSHRVCIVYSTSGFVACLTLWQVTWWYFIARIFSRYYWDILFPHAKHTVESDSGHIPSELPNPLNFYSKMEQQQPVTYSLVRTASNPRSGKPSWQRRRISPNQRGEEQRLQIALPRSIRCGAVRIRTALSYQSTGFELNVLAIVCLYNLSRSVWARIFPGDHIC